MDLIVGGNLGLFIEIKRRLLLGRKTKTNLDSILKSRDTTLLTKGKRDPGEVHELVYFI